MKMRNKVLQVEKERLEGNVGMTLEEVRKQIEKDELELYFEEREKNDPKFKKACEELQEEKSKCLQWCK